MSEKVDFNGDVAQAVMGDVKEAPRLSNVVNLNLSEVQKEVKLITDYQRKRINVLVKEWSAICGDEELEIYKVFIADFGLRKFRELPIEHYLSVKETLERWIVGASKVATPHVRAPEPAVAPLLIMNHEPDSCVACREKDAAFGRLQRTSFAQWILIAILAGSCAWLLYKMPSPHDADQHQADNNCFFEGRPYSAGSTIKAPGGLTRECTSNSSSGSMTWIRPK